MCVQMEGSMHARTHTHAPMNQTRRRRLHEVRAHDAACMHACMHKQGDGLNRMLRPKRRLRHALNAIFRFLVRVSESLQLSIVGLPESPPVRLEKPTRHVTECFRIGVL
mmetsp:Transcript_23028/g.44933  ORF Transcript_23028/g.44933 Transcript_23028/m.44933 type:complete len:109 (+) Transcript_23028:280-606(+)